MVLTKTPICNFGEKTKSFELKGIDGQLHKLEDHIGKNGLLIMFICNHCPYVKAIIKDLVQDCKSLEKFGINSAAICSNDVKNYPEDSFENMVKRADKGMPYPYLHDESQEVALEWGAKRTPEFYLLNGEGEVVYRGRMDNSPRNAMEATTRDLADAMDSLSMGELPPVNRTESIGCSVKWKL